MGKLIALIARQVTKYSSYCRVEAESIDDSFAWFVVGEFQVYFGYTVEFFFVCGRAVILLDWLVLTLQLGVHILCTKLHSKALIVRLVIEKLLLLQKR